MKRSDGRAHDELRAIRITSRFIGSAAGSVLIEAGRTRLICTAAIESGVPPFLVNQRRGWLTAEYAMLPAATGQRRARDGRRGFIDGRTQEIQRLIGRSIRTVVDLSHIGERTIWLDCDVIEADGGTRTLAISGAWVALHQALTTLQAEGQIERWPLRGPLAAVSVGVVDGCPLLDLSFAEDSRAEVDMNVVMTADGEFVEIQGSAERRTFDRDTLDQLLDFSERGIRQILEIQRMSLGLGS